HSEVELALRGEVPVEDRLRDPRLARDLRGRRAPIAPFRERSGRGLQNRAPTVRRRQPRAGGAHAGASTSSVRGRTCRTVATATIAAANAIPAGTCSAAWKPFTNWPA